MPGKPYDATTKDLIEENPAAWAALLIQKQVRSVETVDADLATITAASDKVMRLQTDLGAYLWNLELQSGHDGEVPDRLCFYSVLLRRRHRLPVRSTLLLLRREANSPLLTGRFEVSLPDESNPYLHFHYEVMRIWDMPEELFLQGPLATLPLAPLTDEAARHLPEVIARVNERLAAEPDQALADRLRVATLVLSGLRYPAEVVERLLERVTTMEDSVTYQAIIKKGEARGEARGAIRAEQKTLLRQGKKKFGPPTLTVQAKVENITDLAVLDTLTERILDADSWNDLLATV